MVLGFAADGMVYVLHVVTEQVLAPVFCTTLLALRDRYPGAPFAMFVGGTEIGVLDLFRERGLNIESKPANSVGDKFVRAQPSAASWNAGGILVPASAPWVESFVSVVCGFSGAKGGKDDEVDAMVAAYDRGRARATETTVRCPPPIFMSNQGADFSSVEQPYVVTTPETLAPQARPMTGAEHEADALRRSAMASASPDDAVRPGYAILPWAIPPSDLDGF